VAVAALLAAGCGGAASPTTVAPDEPTQIVALDSGNFDAMVLASPRPCLVEFHNPT
jgi:hypothetical protein